MNFYELLKQIHEAIPHHHPFVGLDDGSKQWNKVSAKFVTAPLSHTNLQRLVTTYDTGLADIFNIHGQRIMLQRAKDIDNLMRQLQEEANALHKATNFPPFAGYYKKALDLRKHIFPTARALIVHEKVNDMLLRQQVLVYKYPQHTDWDFELMQEEQFNQEWKS